jgi:hypothetical protein
MYVREKKITRGDKTYSYYQLVEGRRAGPVVRQRVIKHLGPARSREDADAMARCRGLLCSVPSCGRVGTVEKPVETLYPRELFQVRVCEEHSDILASGERLDAYPLH